MSKRQSPAEYETPGPLPHVRPHEDNRPYIKALGDAIPILSAVLNTASEVLHELTIMKEPANPRTLRKIGTMGDGLVKTGQIIRRGVRTG